MRDAINSSKNKNRKIEQTRLTVLAWESHKQTNGKENESIANLLKVETDAQKKRKDNCITFLAEGWYKQKNETHLTNNLSQDKVRFGEASKREGKDIDRRARKEKENSRDTKDWCAIRRFQNAKREEKEKT